MTNNNHPITPTPETVEKIRHDALQKSNGRLDYELRQIHDAYRTGADQELEACCELLDINGCPGKWIDMLRAARRPEPPSIKEQALEALEKWAEDEYGPGAVFHKGLEVGLIRRALKVLPD